MKSFQPEIEANILVVDDEPDFRELFAEIITRLGYQVVTAANGLEALEFIRQQKIDVALIDFQMPQLNGLELLHEIKKIDEEIAVLFVTGHGSIESAVAAIKQGAYDYITKPIHFTEFENLLQRLLLNRSLIRENRRLKAELRRKYDLQNIIGSSKVMLAVLRQLEQASKNSMPILLEGERGTGKELAAKAIHFNSGRADKPFIPFDCRVLSDELIMVEWAGKEAENSSSDSRYSKKGIFRLAQGGTIFLLEVAALSPAMQKVLLQIIQTNQINLVESTQFFPLDVRLIVGSTSPLKILTAKQSFIAELYQQLSQFQVTLPPLRERLDDIPLLIRYFLQQHSKTSLPILADNTLQILQHYSWPENIWELENVVLHSLAVQKAEVILPNHLPDYILQEVDESFQFGSPIVKSLTQIEKEAILNILEMQNWNLESTARWLQISPAILVRKMKRHHLVAEPTETKPGGKNHSG